MHWKSPAWKNRDLFLVRPLLSFHRHELAAHSKAHHISFREDSSNLDTGPLRNRIRQKLLPLLAAEFGPKALEQPLRSMILTRDVADFIRAEAVTWVRDPSHRAFADLHPALQRECIRHQLIAAQIKPEGELIERLWSHPGTLWNIAAKVRVRLNRDGLLEKFVDGVFSKSKVEVILTSGHGEICFEGLALNWAAESHDGTLPRSGAGTEWLDFEKVGQRVILRHWKPGDRFQPFGMNTPSKLGHLFINAKIPAPERKGLTVATTAAGEIFWIERLRIGDRFKLDKTTSSRLQWCWRRQMTPTKTVPATGGSSLA
jgi:tRNA(Ile)-lysidine synthase